MKISNLKAQRSNGFTLTELLVVIGILIILTSLTVPVFRFFQKESDLNNSAEEIVNILRLAQSKTLASEGASQYGLYFDNTTSPHQYTIFKGNDYVFRDTSFDDIHKLPESVEIYEISLGGGSELFFNRITGNATPAGYLKIRLINDYSKTKNIYIESSGLVSFLNTSSPVNGRVTDSRHVHFTLGWSIQNATNLKFNFPNIPQTEIVDMADYFNIGKTEFNWQRTFVVDGVDQEFRIHTHLLDVSQTLLCIHRDRNDGKNNQEVIIYIVDGGVDKDIAHYLADVDDTVNVEFFGGIMEIQ